jgi:hypothetical protein
MVQRTPDRRCIYRFAEKKTEVLEEGGGGTCWGAKAYSCDWLNARVSDLK